jgi:hypothetical protein
MSIAHFPGNLTNFALSTNTYLRMYTLMDACLSCCQPERKELCRLCLLAEDFWEILIAF